MWKKPHNWLIAAAGLLIIVLLGLNVCHAVNPETGQEYAVRFVDRLIYILFIVLSFILSDLTLLGAKNPFHQVFTAIINAIVLLGFQIWIFVDFFTFGLKDVVGLYPLRRGDLPDYRHHPARARRPLRGRRGHRPAHRAPAQHRELTYRKPASAS